ncbi:Protein prrc1 [Mactra antiquata]
MADFVTSVLALVTALLFLYILKTTTQKNRRYPPGPFGLPLVGHLPFLGNYPPSTLMRWRQQYGNIFSIKLGGWKTVVINGYSAIHEATRHPKDAFSGRPDFVSLTAIQKAAGNKNLTGSTFDTDYLKLHKVMSKALKLFTSDRQDILEDYISFETISCADDMIKKYGSVPGSILNDIELCTLRVSYQMLYGQGEDVGDKAETIRAANDGFNRFAKNGSAIDVMPWLRYLMPGKIKQLVNLILNLNNNQIEKVNERFRTFNPDTIRDTTDAILASIRNGESDQDTSVFSKQRLTFALTDLLVAGYAPTSNYLIWMMLYIVAYPDVQEKVYKEIDAVVKGRKITLKDKKALPYTEAVFLEVGRMVTQTPFGVPHFTIMDAKIGGYDVDKDTVVLLNFYSVHYDKEYWGDPECFRPDRFLDNNGTLDAEKCSRSIPFGTGRRSCLGEQQAKIHVFLSFATMLQKCEFIKAPGEDLDMSKIPGLIYSPHDFRVLDINVTVRGPDDVIIVNIINEKLTLFLSIHHQYNQEHYKMMAEESSDESAELVDRDEAVSAEKQQLEMKSSMAAPAPLPDFLTQSQASSSPVKVSSPTNVSTPANVSTIQVTPTTPIQSTTSDNQNASQSPVKPVTTTSISPPGPQVTPYEASSLISVPAEMEIEPSDMQPQQSGLFGWISNNKMLSKVVEKTKSSMESMITTLDPGMKEVIRSGGDVCILVTSTKESKVSSIREAFQGVFGKATIVGKESQATTAAQPVGFTAGLKGAQERIQNLRQAEGVSDDQPIVSVEGFIVEMLPDRWYEMSCLILQDPQHRIDLQTFSQPSPIPAEYILKAQDRTPKDYPLRWSGLAVTIGQVIEEDLPHIGHVDWQNGIVGVSRKESLYLAAKSLAYMYKQRLPTMFVS